MNQKNVDFFGKIIVLKDKDPVNPTLHEIKGITRRKF